MLRPATFGGVFFFYFSRLLNKDWPLFLSEQTEILPCFCKRVDANRWHNQVFACKPPCRINCRSHDNQSFWGARTILFKESGSYRHKCKCQLSWFLSQRVVDPKAGNHMRSCSLILGTCHKFASFWSFCIWLGVFIFNHP